MNEKRRLNLSLNLSAPLQREAWRILCAIPARRRTDAVCRMICQAREREDLQAAIRSVLREELHRMQLMPKTEQTEQPQAGDVDDDVLGFLFALQQEGDDID